MTADVAEVLRSVAAHGLPGTTPCWPTGPLPEPSWQRLLVGVAHQRLDGLLASAVSSEALPTASEQRRQAEEAHFDAVVRVLRLEAATVRTVDVLEAAGLEARVLKGPAVAHLDHPDPAQRLFGDVDLIVRSGEFDAAVAALTAAGNVRRFPQPRPGFDRRFSKGTSFDAPQGFEIDLHRCFVMGPYGLRMDLRDVWAPGRTFDVGGKRLVALDDEVRFLHACFHAALGNTVPRLVPQRDVAQMLLNDRLDLPRVRALVAGWRCEAVVASALTTSWATLGAPRHPLVDEARAHRPTPRDLRELAVYSDPEGSYAGKSLAAVRALPTWRDRAAFTWALAVPQASYAQDRAGRSGPRWRRGLSAARRLVRA